MYYKIVLDNANHTVIYDRWYGVISQDPRFPDNHMLTEPKCQREIGQAGSLQFTMLPTHPNYDDVQMMETYLSAFRVVESGDEAGNEEIFYGRVIDVNVNQTTGMKAVQCAGALSFLEDVDVAPIQEGQETMTAAQFFTRCINAHNAGVGSGSKRTLTIGNIGHSKASETRKFGLTSYTKVKQALETYIVNEFGGYLRVRRSNNVRYIDWIETYGIVNNSPIVLGENVISQENAFSVNDFYTAIRPIGKNNRVLSTGDGLINIDDNLVAKYGKIIETMSFSEADSDQELIEETNRVIRAMGKGLGKTGTIKIVDMKFLDNSQPKIRLGAVYENIQGFEGEEMTIAAMENDFGNPANDTITLKNRKELLASVKGSATGRGAMSKNNYQGFQNIYKHITETADTLAIHAKLISLGAEEIRMVSSTIETYSAQMDGMINNFYGTGTMQTHDAIVNIAGHFTTKYKAVPSSKLTNDRNPHDSGWYEFHNGNYTASEVDYKSGKELFNWITDALSGRKIDTTVLVDDWATNNYALQYGHAYSTMAITSDTTVVSGHNYYTKTMGFGDASAAEFVLEEEGSQINVGEVISQHEVYVDNLLTEVHDVIEGSALWNQKDNITGVVGQFEVVHDQTTGEDRLVVVSGGGLTLKPDNTEFGIYTTPAGEHSAVLTAGIIVNKINNQSGSATYTTGIKGDKIWLGSEEYGGVGETIINTLSTRVYNLEADAITANTLSANIALLSNVTVNGLYSRNDIAADGTMYATSYGFRNGGGTGTLNTALADLQVVPVQGGSKLQMKRFNNSAWVDVATFSSAVSTISGSWSGTTFTASIDPDAQSSTATTLVILQIESSLLASDMAIAKIYHDSPTSANMLTSTDMQLVEYVGTKKVKLIVNTLDKAEVSTQDTYDAGVAAGEVTGATAGYNSAKVKGTWSDNTLTVSKVSTGSNDNSLSFNIRPYLTTTGAAANQVKIYVADYTGGNQSAIGSATDLYVVQNGSGSDATAQIRTGNGASSGTKYAEVSIGGLYTGGWDDGYDEAKDYSILPSAGTGTSFIVKFPNAARTGSEDKTFTITKGTPSYNGGYAAVSLSGTVVGRIDISNWWTDGYDTARSYAILPSAGTDTSFIVQFPKLDRSGSENKTFSITKGTPSADGGYAAVSLSGTTVGRIALDDWWDGGYDSAKLSALVWDGNSCTISKTDSGADSRTFSVTASKDISYNSTRHRYEGTCYANVSGTARHSSSYTSGTEAYEAGGVVATFSVSTPNGESSGGYTNNTDGYYLNNGAAAIVIKGAIVTAGKSGAQTKNTYITSAPTKIYQKGKSDADALYTQVRDGGGNQSFVAYYYNSTYGRYESLGSHKWYYK